MIRPQNLWPRFAPPPRASRDALRTMFVITSMPVGGAETLLVNLVSRLDPQRIRPEVVCLKEPGPLGESLAQSLPVHAGLIGAKWDVRVLPRLVALLRRCRADAVVTVGAGDKMFWGRLAAWSAGVPVILSALHSTGWPDGVGRMNRWLTPITDGFIAVADHHAVHLRDVEKFPGGRVHTIRNGVDTERFAPAPDASRRRVREQLGISADAPLVGIVAALRPEKNHTMFVRVARRVIDSRPDARFLIIGDGPERPNIEQSIREAGVGEQIHVLGTRHDTPQLVSALDAFLLCSHNEASPVSILEALSCGVPVIATRVGSVGESVVDGETGYVVDVDDDEAMAARLLHLVTDRQHAQRLGTSGRERVEQSGSLASMVDGYTRLIERLYDQQVGGLSSSRCRTPALEPSSPSAPR